MHAHAYLSKNAAYSRTWSFIFCVKGLFKRRSVCGSNTSPCENISVILLSSAVAWARMAALACRSARMSSVSQTSRKGVRS